MVPSRERRARPRVSAAQVAAFRLDHQRLAHRVPRARFPSVLLEMGGAQAQLLPAAELSIWARVRGLRPGEVDAALWKRRSVARVWCMRRTLHLVPSAQAAMFVRGTALRAEREIRWMDGKGVRGPVLERALEQVLLALDRPTTPTELAGRVGAALGARVGARRGGGWGGDRPVAWVDIGGVHCPAGYLLHLAGARGVICSGPARGTEATFVRADAWLSGWRDIAPERAEGELLGRYLRSHGPATPADFAAWSGVRLTDARAIWAREQAALTPVEVEGSERWILAEDLSALESAELDRPSVQLLPYFDSFLLGHRDRTHLVGAVHHETVYRPQGWVYPVVLVDGAVAGIWSHRREGGDLRVQVTWFSKTVSRDVAARVREEAEELGRFLGCSVVTAEVS
jgi:uncharacterized protein YcaQ